MLGRKVLSSLLQGSQSEMRNQSQESKVRFTVLWCNRADLPKVRQAQMLFILRPPFCRFGRAEGSLIDSSQTYRLVLTGEMRTWAVLCCAWASDVSFLGRP